MKKRARSQSMSKTLMNVIVSSVLAVSSAIILMLLSFTLFLLTESSVFKTLPVRPYSYYPLGATGASILLLGLSLIFLFRNIRMISIAGKIPIFTPYENKKQVSEAKQISEDVTQFLDNGERDIYGILVDAGGTLLQRDITSVKGYSKATITRILNRLEAKGLIEKMRHGTTNQIVLKRISK